MKLSPTSAGKSCNYRSRRRSFFGGYGSVQQHAWLKKGSTQESPERFTNYEVNETRENYDSALHGYTGLFVTNPFLVC